jgi:hypothetical protein
MFGLLSRRNNNSSAVEDPKDYQAMPADGSAAGVGLLHQRGAASTTRSSASTPTGIAAMEIDSYKQPYSYSTPGTTTTAAQSQDFDDIMSVKTEEPGVFDANGNRAPYREGPYDCHHHEDGRLIKKRWCKLYEYATFFFHTRANMCFSHHSGRSSSQFQMVAWRTATWPGHLSIFTNTSAP